MRPGPIGPGISTPTEWQRLESLASMRPGPIGPGINKLIYWANKKPRASMRLGPIGPGISAVGHGRVAGVQGFNEAGANWPRNYLEHYENTAVGFMLQ